MLTAFKRNILYRYGGFPKPIYGMVIAAFLRSSGNVTMMFMTLYLTQKLHFPLTNVGYLLLWFGVGSLTGAYGGAIFVSRIGPRRMMDLVLLVGSLPFFILVFVRDPILIGMVIFFMGLFDGAYRPTYNSIIMHLCSPTERSRSYSLYLIGINVGFSVAGAVGGLLANINYHYIFVVNGLLVAAAGLLMHQAIPASINLKEKNHNKAVGEGGATAANPYKDFGFMLICISVLLSFLVSNQIGSTYAVYLTDFYHISPSLYGLMLTLSGLMIVVLQLPMTQLMERYPGGAIASLGTFLLCAGFAILPFSTAGWFAFFSVIIWTLGEIMLYPPVLGLVMARAEKGKVGHYLGIYHSLFSLVHFSAAPIGTAIYGIWGGSVLWYISGAVGLAATLFMWMGTRLRG